MKKTLGMVVALLVFLAGCIYIVFSSPVPTITHIKFEGDKSFIIGINNHNPFLFLILLLWSSNNSISNNNGSINSNTLIPKSLPKNNTEW